MGGSAAHGLTIVLALDTLLAILTSRRLSGIDGFPTGIGPWRSLHSAVSQHGLARRVCSPFSAIDLGGNQASLPASWWPYRHELCPQASTRSSRYCMASHCLGSSSM